MPLTSVRSPSSAARNASRDVNPASHRASAVAGPTPGSRPRASRTASRSSGASAGTSGGSSTSFTTASGAGAGRRGVTSTAFTYRRVHRTRRPMRPRSSWFAWHLWEKKWTVPSFRTYILPVPGSMSFPQKVQVRVTGMAPYLTESFRASRAVSRSMRVSPTCTVPFTFRVMMRPRSRPSRTRTFT